MRSIDETFETFGKRVLWLGYAGEEDRSTLIVDLHDILLEFPGATAVLKVRPPDEKAAYPAVTETIDDKLHWSISDSDTAKEGRGELQLSLISPTGSKIKTAVAAMEISRSLPDGGKKPDRIDDWMEKAEAARKKRKRLRQLLIPQPTKQTKQLLKQILLRQMLIPKQNWLTMRRQKRLMRLKKQKMPLRRPTKRIRIS